MSNHDPFELVAAANPVPGLTERLPGDAEMLAAIMATPVAPEAPVRRRPRRRTIWIGAGVAVASLGLAAFAFIREESAKNPLSLSCFAMPQKSPPNQVVMTMTPDPVAACGELWTNGTIASFNTPPVLTACVLETGVVAVIPGSQQVCSTLGLANWVGELSARELDLLALQDEVISTFLDRCISQAESMATVRALMAKYSISEWRIIYRGGYSSTRQCTAISVEPATESVVVTARRGTAAGN